VTTHDVRKFAESLNLKMGSRARHLCVLLGAGSSLAAGLPAMMALEKSVTEGLEGDQRRQFEAASAVAESGLEATLTRIRRIAAVAKGIDTIDGMTGEAASLLDKAICELIVKALSKPEANAEHAERFAAWAGRASHKAPIEVFTTNYDLLLESGLEERGVPYFDGFVGVIDGRFRADMVEAAPGADAWLPDFIVRLWKLHGSVNWHWTKDGREIRRGHCEGAQALPAAVYPSEAKYTESRRMPFLALQDRFRRAIGEPETLLLVAGYSFGDEHLNEIIFDAGQQHPRTEIDILCYADLIPEVVDRAKSLPNLQLVGDRRAVIAGVEGVWAAPSDTDALPEDLWRDGRFTLGDFACLATFLARATISDEDPTDQLRAVLRPLFGDDDA